MAAALAANLRSRRGNFAIRNAAKARGPALILIDVTRSGTATFGVSLDRQNLVPKRWDESASPTGRGPGATTRGNAVLVNPC